MCEVICIAVVYVFLIICRLKGYVSPSSEDVFSDLEVLLKAERVKGRSARYRFYRPYNAKYYECMDMSYTSFCISISIGIPCMLILYSLLVSYT